MMVLAEGVHTLGLFQIPEFMLPLQEELELDQSYKFTLYKFLAFMELKFVFHPRQRQVETLGW